MTVTTVSQYVNTIISHPRSQSPKMAPNEPYLLVFIQPLCSSLTLNQGWSVCSGEIGIGSTVTVWPSRLDYKRHCGFCLLSLITQSEGSHRTVKQTYGEVHVVRH